MAQRRHAAQLKLVSVVAAFVESNSARWEAYHRQKQEEERAAAMEAGSSDEDYAYCVDYCDDLRGKASYEDGESEDDDGFDFY